MSVSSLPHGEGYALGKRRNLDGNVMVATVDARCYRAYIATALIHLKGDRKGLALMFTGYSVANLGAYMLEAKR